MLQIYKILYHTNLFAAFFGGFDKFCRDFAAKSAKRLNPYFCSSNIYDESEF